MASPTLTAIDKFIQGECDKTPDFEGQILIVVRNKVPVKVLCNGHVYRVDHGKERTDE